jgi:hypothetical protein
MVITIIGTCSGEDTYGRGWPRSRSWLMVEVMVAVMVNGCWAAAMFIFKEGMSVYVASALTVVCF